MKEKDVVQAKQELVQKDELQMSEKAEKAQEISDECQERLSQCIPKLNEALEALKILDVKDFIEMKQYNKPPTMIRIAMSGICIMLERRPKRGTDDYWDEAKSLLNKPEKFLHRL